MIESLETGYQQIRLSEMEYRWQFGPNCKKSQFQGGVQKVWHFTVIILDVLFLKLFLIEERMTGSFHNSNFHGQIKQDTKYLGENKAFLIKTRFM